MEGSGNNDIFWVYGGFWVFVFLIIWIFFTYHIREGKKLAKEWKEVMRGVYSHAIYGFDIHEERSGAMVHTTRRYNSPCTIIYFDDERTYVCENQRLSMPFSKGREIRIFQNGLGAHKIETVNLIPAHQIPCS